MPKIQIIVSNESADKLTDHPHDALSLFSWALQEAAIGRFVLSENKDGEDKGQVVVPALHLVNCTPPELPTEET